MSEAKEAQAPGKSKTVTVACKHPAGIQMRLFKMIDNEVPVLGGGTKVEKVAEQVGGIVKINGYAAPFGHQPEHPVAGGKLGYALTFGVDREFFEAWLEANKGSDLVRNGLIFATDSEQRARDKAVENKKIKSGLEPLDPKNLPKLSRTLKVETATEREAA